MKHHTEHKAIAIVGVGAVLPDAPNVPAFWNGLTRGHYAVGDIPDDRWSSALYYDADPKAPDKAYSKIGGFVREFDWEPLKWRLPIPPKVADAMDRSQKWAIVAAREALADYGGDINKERTAVILGNAMGGDKHYLTAARIMFPEYADSLEHAPSFAALPADVRTCVMREMHQGVEKRFPAITEDTMPGELANIIAGRVASLFDLHGPNYIADAACASAIAAMNAAIEGLEEYDYDTVLTGGVDANMSASSFIKFCKIGALSATGTRPFDEGADGFVMGEGAAIFLLKRLEDAERDGDSVYAVIRGIGGSSDGKGKGITAPNPIGQQLAVQRAWTNAGVSPATATMIEAHGTSTRVGDVVEVDCLRRVWDEYDLPEGRIALGSVKSNLGHLKGAAGAAGMLKAALCLKHKQLVPSLGFKSPNPKIDWSGPFRVNTEQRSWDETVDGIRRAGVSAFGFGGTNFHAVLEEHVPGRIAGQRKRSMAVAEVPWGQRGVTASAGGKAPLRGALVLGAESTDGLTKRLKAAQADAGKGVVPERQAPAEADLRAPQRIAIDFVDAADLAKKCGKALKAMASDHAGMWKALRAQGVFRGEGTHGKVAFLFPGQGSQYVNMLALLRNTDPVVEQTVAEADRTMTPLLGKPLSSLIYADPDDKDAMKQTERSLRQTAVTQPAMLTIDTAISRLLSSYGIAPDMVIGHSLGEYGALVACGAMDFGQALKAVSARGTEMTKVSVEDNGAMVAVFGDVEDVRRIIDRASGYLVIANWNSRQQVVVGGATKAVEQVIGEFEKAGLRAVPLPVSHAFHTEIVAPASEPLKRVLKTLDVHPPSFPIISNVTGDFHPMGPNAVPEMIELLGEQIASPVQFVKGLESLYDAGARIFVEVGPKRALFGMVEDVLSDRDDVIALFTNHPKVGEIVSFNQALCAFYAAGLGLGVTAQETAKHAERAPAPAPAVRTPALVTKPMSTDGYEKLGRILAEVMDRASTELGTSTSVAAAREAVFISGASLGLPGTERVFDDGNITRLLQGETFIDAIPMRQRRAILDRNITRLIKDQGEPRFERIDSLDDVLKLAGRAGAFELDEEFGVPSERLSALDATTRLAIAAGVDALRDAGVPLAMRYKTTTKGTLLPDRWMLPEALRDETGVIFGSAFPGYDALAEDMKRYHEARARAERLADLESLRNWLPAETPDSVRVELDHRIATLTSELEAHPYLFDRRYVFKILSMGHSQFAEYIGARGPNTQINAACASGTQAIALAADWISQGRCRRVICITADDVTSDNLLGWLGAGFLASGAAATDASIEEAALPFDRRRHGLILGMGASGIVVESASASRERGMRPICEVLGTVTANSAFHGSRLDVAHIADMMEQLVAEAERRHGIDRHRIARELVFVSHETYTPARGGSAQAEVSSLRSVFGDSASEIVVANTKGFTGHAMGAAIEDTVAVKILETGIVPPVANYKEVDPELGTLNLSRGGTYPVRYALRLGAGFGSQLAMSLLRWVPTADGRRSEPHALGYHSRLADSETWRRWLRDISGQEGPELEVSQRTLRIKDVGRAAAKTSTRVAARTPAPKAPAAKAPAAEAPAAELAPAPAPAPAAASDDAVRTKVLEIVAKQTGYPPDMIEMDLDLEADLGIDTVKQAETFAAVREAYGIERDENMQLSEFPTLEHVVDWVLSKRPDLAASEPAPGPAPTPPAAPAPSPAPTAATAAGDAVRAKVLEIVAAQTGYPPDMIEMDLDLEADLGIDTVKQAETFAAVREAYGMERDENLQLSEFPTLEHVVGWVLSRRPDLAASEPAPAAALEPAAPAQPAKAEQPTTATAADDDDIVNTVLAIVAEQTGYPPDMIEMDLDLEADLGIDTVKQAETFAAVREAYGIDREENLQLSEFPTLEHVVGWVKSKRPAAPQAAPSADDAPAPTGATKAEAVPRRTPVAVVRPALAACKATHVGLDAGRRVIVAHDDGGVGKALAKKLTERGVDVLSIEGAPTTEELAGRLTSWLGDGPVHGVFWLPALDRGGSLEQLDIAGWREALRRRVKLLYATMRALYQHVAKPDTFLLSATRLGGRHGYDAVGAIAPMGGAVCGFSKTYKRERPEALVKVVDFSDTHEPAVVADLLIEEALRDPGAIEIGYADSLRWGVGLAEASSVDGKPGFELHDRTVMLITGAAGSIVSAITANLSQQGGVYYLLDLADAPDRDNPDLARSSSDREGLMRDLKSRLQERGERGTPAQVQKELAGIERSVAAVEAISAIEKAGGTAHWRQVDLRDAARVGAIVDEIRQAHGRVDVLLHAAGLEISRMLPDKEPAEFNLVFDVKADGWFNLMRAAAGMPIGATVAFSSIAGRFGNGGQPDYAAANDLLCKYATNMRTTRPDTRGIAIDWTAWAGIGMASRGSIPKMMELAGIDMLPPEFGIGVVRRELTDGATTGEVVIAGALGVLLEDWDESGGLEPASQAPAGPMSARVISITPTGAYAIETELDPSEQPFLHDHAIDGTPVLPGVMGIEAFAEAARALLPDWHVSEVENIEFLAPFKFYRSETRKVRVEALVSQAGEGLAVDCRLIGSRVLHGRTEPQETTHFTGRVQMHREPPSAERIEAPPAPDGPTVDAESIYRVYFHGPAYRVVDLVWRDNGRIVGRMPAELPPHHQPTELPMSAAPRLVELCFQTAGVLEIGTSGAFGLPRRIDRVRVLQSDAQGRLCALVRSAGSGVYDATVVDEQGGVLVEVRGYRTETLGRVSDDLRQPLALVAEEPE